MTLGIINSEITEIALSPEPDEKNPSEEDKITFYLMLGSLANPIRDYNYLVNKINENKKESSRFEVTIKMGFETTEEIKEFKKIIKI